VEKSAGAALSLSEQAERMKKLVHTFDVGRR
jgi:hypothetical protein